jgi:cell division protein ZapB
MDRGIEASLLQYNAVAPTAPNNASYPSAGAAGPAPGRLTHAGHRSILATMENDTEKDTTEQQLEVLEERVDELIRVCEHLALENQSLQSQNKALAAERDELLEQYEQARQRVDTIVARLRGLEQ